jgi:hypothetical protein
MMDRPSKLPPPPRWMTYVPDRYNSKFKNHTDIGTAKGAINYSRYRGVRGGILYEFVDGDWVERAFIEPGSSLEDSRRIMDTISNKKMYYRHCGCTGHGDHRACTTGCTQYASCRGSSGYTDDPLDTGI